MGWLRRQGRRRAFRRPRGIERVLGRTAPSLIVIGLCGYALITGNSSVDLADVSDSETNVIKVYYGAAVVILITAFFVLIVSFFGCCGAWKVRYLGSHLHCYLREALT